MVLLIRYIKFVLNRFRGYNIFCDFLIGKMMNGVLLLFFSLKVIKNCFYKIQLGDFKKFLIYLYINLFIIVYVIYFLIKLIIYEIKDYLLFKIMRILNYMCMYICKLFRIY